MQHANLVAQHLDHECTLVVCVGRLAVQAGNGDLVDELSDAIGGDFELHLARHSVGRQADPRLADDLPVAAQLHRGRLTGHPVRHDRRLELRDVFDERELPRAHVGDADVDNGRGSGGDRGDGDAKRLGDGGKSEAKRS